MPQSQHALPPSGPNLLNVMASILGMSNPGLTGFFTNIFPDISCRAPYSRMVFAQLTLMS